MITTFIIAAGIIWTIAILAGAVYLDNQRKEIRKEFEKYIKGRE
jgi:hypothetical protein